MRFERVLRIDGCGWIEELKGGNFKLVETNRHCLRRAEASFIAIRIITTSSGRERYFLRNNISTTFYHDSLQHLSKMTIYHPSTPRRYDDDSIRILKCSTN